METYIDSSSLRRMFLRGTVRLESKKEWINELNVFPVPDGDTGTNMCLTLMSAVQEIEKLPADTMLPDLCGRIAFGTLRGARGNSGVIMSQLCRGFYNGIEKADRIDKKLLASALDQAVKAAYKAVLQPKEGTILTVAKAVAQKARELLKESLPYEKHLFEILRYAREVLSRTPEMLPVLKEAGVVDSGGQGLVEFLQGACTAFGENQDEEAPISLKASLPDHPDPEDAPASKRRVVDSSSLETSDIRFGYCTEFIIERKDPLSEQEEDSFRDYLSSMGNSVVCVSMDTLVKVHVHTNHPGEVIEKALTYGELTSLKIDNMRIEHREKVIMEADRIRQAQIEKLRSEKEYGFVSVCCGDGIARVFRDLNTDLILEGGQTMNPSTQDMLSAISKVDARHVFLFPNNSNIILAANQAKQLCKDKEVHVIPTRNVCEGINAVIHFDESLSPAENEKQMEEAASQVRFGEVTHAIRSAWLNGKEIHEGNYIGIGNDKVLSASEDLEEAAFDMIRDMASSEDELITVYYGASVSEQQVSKLVEKVEEEFPGAEVEAVDGGQEIYNYLVSVE